MRRRTAEILTGLTGAGLAAVVAVAGATGTSTQVEKPKPAATRTAEPENQFPTSPIPSYLRPAAQAVIRAYQAAQQPGSGMRVTRQDYIFGAPTEDISFTARNGDRVELYFTSAARQPTSPSQINGLGMEVDSPGLVPDQPNSSGVQFYDMGDEWGGHGAYLTHAPDGRSVTEHYSALRTFGPDRACYGLRVKREGNGELKARCNEQDLGQMALADNVALANQIASVAQARPNGAVVVPVTPRPNTSFTPFVSPSADLVPA